MIGRKLKKRYEIREHLGDGSTATVYKARDTRLERDVALKVLLPHVRENTRKRFFQEATAAAKLNHPNIMAIYDMDEEDGQAFLVVEYVDGQPLTRFIPSPPEVVCELGSQIASALHYAHERDIIHRDIKPANIKVTLENQVKIMDLGLALRSETKRLTADGMIIGTPAYLSPEQAQGLKLDPRTDIYSLGVVLYEMATGQLPFDADDISALLLQQVKQPPAPPRLIVPDMPIGLENIILNAMEKQPARRFQTSAAMASALHKVVEIKEQSEAPTQAMISAEDRERLTQANHTQPAPAHAHGGRSRPVLRIILADDHTILRKTLVSFIEAQGDFVVVAEADNGESALKQAVSLLPDVLLLDLNMPGKGGLDILPDVRKEAPTVKVLVLTGRDEDLYIMRALRAGAHGYLLKSTSEEELLTGLVNVTKGHLVLGHGVAEKVVNGLLTGHTGDGKLNEQERQVLLYVAGGYENDAIARELSMSMPAVIETLAQSMNKLGAKDRHSAAVAALRNGEILLDDLHKM